MQTNRDRILGYLQEQPEGADDDELAVALGFSQRQTANSICRQLEKEGHIIRVKRPSEKIINFWKDGSPVEPDTASKRKEQLVTKVPREQVEGSDPHEDWYWEGNVQSKVVKFLAEKRYSIIRVANTKDREKGKDIIAKSGPNVLWVTVKGYPRPTEKTPAAVQAGHWFSSAMFDIICWHGENPDVELVLALPDFKRYRDLADRVAWLRSVARFSFFWVQQSGEIYTEL